MDTLNTAVPKTTLPVEGLARVRAFYAEKLGLRPTCDVYTVAKLKGRGVRFEEYDFPGLKTNHGIADLGYERAAWFRDIEGSLLALGQLT
jgi:hypothetical protein